VSKSKETNTRDSIQRPTKRDACRSKKRSTKELHTTDQKRPTHETLYRDPHTRDSIERPTRRDACRSKKRSTKELHTTDV